MAEQQPLAPPTDDFSKLNIHQKILKIADAAGVLQKNKEGFGYKYVTEEEIQAKVTAGMQKYHVMLYCSIVPGTLNIEPYTYKKYDAKIKGEKTMNEFIVKADTIYTWVNTDCPEEKVEIPWVMAGQMDDVSMAGGSGLTYFNRYFLMKSLQLATSEADPDAYRAKQKEAENYEEVKKQEAADEDAKKTLAASISKVVAKGSELIGMGYTREDMLGVVKKLSGQPSPAKIKDVAVCEKILKEFDEMGKNNPKEKPAPEQSTAAKTVKSKTIKGAKE